jgi:hypothetical protein
MNFLDIYKKIRSIDEAGPEAPAPAAPTPKASPYGGPPKTHGPIVLGQQQQPAKGTPAQMAAAEQVYNAAIKAGKTNAEAEAEEQAALTGVSHNLDGTPKAAAPAPAAPAAAAAPTGPIDYSKRGPFSKDSMGQTLEYGIPINAQQSFMEPNPDLPDAEYAQQRVAYKAWIKDYRARYPNATQQPDGSWKPEPVVPTGTAPVTESQDIEECGDMMPHSPAQQDIVDMNVTLHGSGPGGIRDLMSILRDIEGKDSNGGMTVEPHAGDIEVMLGDMEEEYGNSVRGASGPQTASIQDVTNVGTTTNGGDHTRNRQAGLPQANAHAMHETVKSRLQQQYDAIKQEGAFTDMADTKLGDMPGKLATGAKQMYNKASTAVGNAATAVSDTTPRQIGQAISKVGGEAATGINNAVNNASSAVRNFARFPGLAPQPVASGQSAQPIAAPARAAGQPATTGQAGQPATTGQGGYVPLEQMSPAEQADFLAKQQASNAQQKAYDDAQAQTQAGQTDIARESTDFARVKHLTKILNG